MAHSSIGRTVPFHGKKRSSTLLCATSFVFVSAKVHGMVKFLALSLGTREGDASPVVRIPQLTDFHGAVV